MENAANRAWHVPREAVLVGDRCQLLDEERVSLGGLGDSRSDRQGTPSASSIASESASVSGWSISVAADALAQFGLRSRSWGG